MQTLHNVACKHFKNNVKAFLDWTDTREQSRSKRTKLTYTAWNPIQNSSHWAINPWTDVMKKGKLGVSNLK